MIHEVLVVFALCSAGQAQAPPARPLDVAAVLDRWEAGTKLIESYDLVVELESRSLTVKTKAGTFRLPDAGEVSPVQLYHSHIVRKGQKRFGEFGGDGKGHYELTLLYDGEMVTSSSRGRGPYIIERDAMVFGSLEYEDYEASYRTILGLDDRIAASRTRNPRLLPREGTNYVVAVPVAKDGSLSNFLWDVWLDPAKNFLPVRLTQSFVQAGREIRDRECAFKLGEVAEGVWAPIEATISVYNKDETSQIFGKVGGIHSLRVDLEKSRFNVPLPDELFVAKIPVGAAVVDRMRNVVYHQGSSDPEGYLAKLAADGKRHLENLPPGDRAPGLTFVPDRPGAWPSGRVVAAGVAVLVAAVAMAIGFLRFSRRRG